MSLKQTFSEISEKLLPGLARQRQRREAAEQQTQWYLEQQRQLKAGEEVKPPWIVFPLSSPDYGWDQGYGEGWKLKIWLPFWKGLSEAKQTEYLEKWQPPTEEWYKTLTIAWVNKLKKSERWHKKQLEEESWHGEIAIPWQAFPNNPSVYEWEESEKEKWLKKIWIPFWSKMSGEAQDKYLEYKSPPDDEWLRALTKYKIRNLKKELC